MGVAGFVHTGVVVDDLAAVVEFLTTLGLECGKPMTRLRSEPAEPTRQECSREQRRASHRTRLSVCARRLVCSTPSATVDRA